MRVGMFCDMYMPHLSGVTNHIRLYKRTLEKLGHDVWVFTFGSRTYVDDEPNIVRSAGVPWGRTGWQAGLRLAEEARELIPTMDIAHTHHPFLSGRIAVKHAGAAGIPVVFTNHTRYDLYSDAYAKFLPRRTRMEFLRTYLHEFAHEVDAVIAPSEGIAEWLSEFGVTDQATVMPNAIDAHAFARPASPASKALFGFAEDTLVLCYLGRLGPEKNLALLIDAFVQAATTNPRVCLLLIGDGPGRSMATERVWAHGLSDRVHFAGKIPYEHVPDLLAAADAFVTASVSEVHPLVVLEAMAAGLPAIGVRSPGVGDIVQHGRTGFLAGEDAGELAGRMLDLACDRELLGRFSDAARSAAMAYDIGPATTRLVGLYERQQA